jgi:hypothetical protein
MSKLAIAALAAATVVLAGTAAPAQKGPAPSPAAEPCPCPDEAPPARIRESAFDDCRDGVDNDGDGHVDCADQDCGIYAMCVAGQPAAAAPPPPAAPPVGKTYATMRELKVDLKAGSISGRDFWRWQQAIRLRRAAELDQAEADYRARAITHAEYHARVAAIKAKYEG